MRCAMVKASWRSWTHGSAQKSGESIKKGLRATPAIRNPAARVISPGRAEDGAASTVGQSTEDVEHRLNHQLPPTRRCAGPGRATLTRPSAQGNSVATDRIWTRRLRGHTSRRNSDQPRSRSAPKLSRCCETISFPSMLRSELHARAAPEHGTVNRSYGERRLVEHFTSAA